MQKEKNVCTVIVSTGCINREQNKYYLKLYSGRLKHPFSLTTIDRYSLGKLMFKLSVGYDFMLAIMQNNMNYATPLNRYCNFYVRT